MQNINKGAGQRNLIAYFAIMAMQASVVSYLCNISAGSCAYAMLKEGQTKKKAASYVPLYGECILMVEIKRVHGIARSQLVKVLSCLTAGTILFAQLLHFKYLFRPK